MKQICFATAHIIELIEDGQYDSFRIYTDSANIITDFDKEISENQIDKDYISEFDQAATTQEFVSVQNKYIDLWKEKYEYYY